MRARASVSRSQRHWSPRAGAFIAGARDVGGELGALASRDAVRAVSIDLSVPDGPLALVAHAEEYGGLDILVNNVGVVAVRLAGIRERHRRPVAVVAEPELHGGGANDACGADAHVETGWWLYRDRQLGQFLPSRSWHHRLLRGEGGVGEFLEGDVQGGWSQRDSDEHRESRSGRDGAVARSGGSGRDHREGVGVDTETARDRVVASQGGFVTGRFTRPDEVADLVLFLASDRSANITGADFVIDGGLIKTL